MANRGMNPAVAAILADNTSRLCALVSLDFGTDDWVRVNNTGLDLEWSCNTYLGVGGLGAISAAEESTEIQAYDMTFSLATADSLLLAKALNSNYKGKFAYLKLAALDSNYDIEDNPLTVFAGRMYNMEITLGHQSSINVIASSRLSDWENPHGGRFNHSTQIDRVDDQDRGFEYVTLIGSTEIVWGDKNLPATIIGDKWQIGSYQD